MKQLKKLKLSNLSMNELDKRELNRLRGGGVCCICGSCGSDTLDAIMRNANANNAGGQYSPGGGYGNGSD